jgi:hypothetical protein
LLLPPVKIDFLKGLTDETGLIQHAKYATPCRREGYTTDDNARALIACTNYFSLSKKPSVNRLVDIYLSFLLYMQREDGKMHNILSYDRKFMDEVGSEDSMGHTIWACGYCVNSKLPNETKIIAKEIFDKAFKWASTFTSPRAQALSTMGLFHYQKAYPADPNAASNMKFLGNKLLNLYEHASSNAWNWFEPYLTYANARLPHALFLAYECIGETKYLQVASKSMDFLTRMQTINRTFVSIGNRGWYKKGAERALYDQQPIEAACTTEAAVAAHRNTGKEEYRRAAIEAFEWFFGKNLQGLSVYDSRTGGCCDGITSRGLNLNKGAEATTAYLQARLSLEEINNRKSTAMTVVAH